MHNHECRHCGENYLCDEPADECFERFITCQECFWKHDFRHFLLVAFLAIVALIFTFYLIRGYREIREIKGNEKEPVFAAPARQ